MRRHRQGARRIGRLAIGIEGTNAVGLTYQAQFSDNPINSWLAGLAPSVTSLGADWERVTVRDAVGGPNPRRFAKVVVTLVP